MIALGHVRNGVVVFEKGVSFPEGQPVAVFPRESPCGDDSLPRHSGLDIPPVNLGEVLIPLSSADDLLGELLEDRS